MLSSQELIARLHAIENLSEFARESGVSRKQLHRIRAGDNSPTLETAEKIVAALNRLFPPVEKRKGERRKAA
jgi:DNA-binding phage protein